LALMCAAAAVVAAGERMPETRSPRMRHLTVEDGLSHDVVYAVVQDAVGFMWFGTQEGLDRYDGSRFEAFRHDPDDSASLASDDVSDLFVDSSGDLWIGTWGGGLDRFDPRTERFHHLQIGASGLKDDRIHDITEDRNGTIWVGTFAGGLSRIDRSEGAVVTFSHDPSDPQSLPSDRVWAVEEDRYGRLWVGTDAGLACWKPADGDFEVWQRGSGEPHDLPSNIVRALAVDRLGVLWVGTEAGLRALDPGADRLRRPGGERGELLAQIPVNTIVSDHTGDLWVGSYGSGLVHMDRSTGGVQQHVNRLVDPWSLAHNDVQGLFEDHSGILWIATRGGGVDRFDLKPVKFQVVALDPTHTGDVGHQRVQSVLRDSRDHLWVGTLSGLDRYRPDLRSWEHYPLGSGLAGESVQSLFEDSDGVLWATVWKRGLCRFLPAEERFACLQVDPSVPSALTSDRAGPIVEGPEGWLWVGTLHGVHVIDRSDGEVVARYAADPDRSATLTDSFVTALLSARSGAIWVGTEAGGLHRFDHQTGRFEVFQHRRRDATSLSSNRILSLWEAPDGHVWVGTARGLDRLDPATGRCERYGVDDGLSSNTIVSLIGDQSGRLWCGTNRGLCVVRDGGVRCYTPSDGLQGWAFSPRACTIDSAGLLYFGGLSGLNVFDPNAVRDNPNVPRIAVRWLTVRGPDGNNRRHHLSSDHDATLSWQENFFAVTYAALDYTDPQRNRYEYQLEGFDAAWVRAGARTEATYTGVPPGSYRFRVRGCNSDGVWNEAGASFELVITPPVWQRWWFRLLAAVLVIGLVAGGVRWRVRALEADRERLESLVSERTRALEERQGELEQLNETKNEFLGIAAHDLRSPLGMIVGWASVLRRRAEQGRLGQDRTVSDLDRIVQVADQMSRLVSELLDISAIESGTVWLERQLQPLAPVLEECVRRYQPLAVDKGIELAFEAAEEGVDVPMDRERVLEVVDNLVSNALKFTNPGGSVRIGCQRLDGVAEVHVADTGQGLSADDLSKAFTSFGRLSATPTAGEPSTGLGLAIVKKIVEMHGGTVAVDSELEHGSTFRFTLPMD
jgi:signal transduction histidine kinase/ligand-binding sensor domain-containing protein